MTSFVAVLEFSDYALIALIVAVFAEGAVLTKRQGFDLGRLERRLKSVEQKLDALLKHEGIEPPPPPPSGLSPEVEQLARDPRTKIAVIKLCRQENPGVGLAEAKEKLEAFSGGRPWSRYGQLDGQTTRLHPAAHQGDKGSWYQS